VHIWVNVLFKNLIIYQMYKPRELTYFGLTRFSDVSSTYAAVLFVLCVLQTQVQQSEKFIDDYHTYQDSQIKARDWLITMRERLSVIVDFDGDFHKLSSRRDQLQVVIEKSYSSFSLQLCVCCVFIIRRLVFCSVEI